MATTSTRVIPEAPDSQGILPLQNGDRLTRAEFERRYQAMPDLKKAELIEGVVYLPSPVSFEQHGGPQSDLITWLGVYRAHTPGVQAGDNSTIRLDLDNEPQPDAFLRVDPVCGGQSRTGPEGYVEGSPELVAEVAASSASYDLHAKLNVYRRNGGREYVVWRVREKAVDWFILRESRYERLPPTSSCIYQSEAFPGLWLDPAALVRGDLIKVLQELQPGLESPEHASFVARLQPAAPQSQP